LTLFCQKSINHQLKKMTHSKLFFVLILLTINMLACKDEPAKTPQEQVAAPIQADSVGQVASATNHVPAPSTAKPINAVINGSIQLKDGTQIALPKDGDKSSIVIFFATPGAKSPEMTALSNEGVAQAGRLTRTLANAKLSVVWAEGNTGMQSALGTAKENAAEFNLLEPATFNETIKETLHNQMGKKVLFVASPAIIADLLVQLAGKQVVQVPSGYSPVLYCATVRAMGDADVLEMSY